MTADDRSPGADTASEALAVRSRWRFLARWFAVFGAVDLAFAAVHVVGLQRVDRTLLRTLLRGH